MKKAGRKFDRQVAIVTAASSGIGYAIAEKFGREGAAVVICSRKEDNVKVAVERLRRSGCENVHGIVCHVAKEEDRKKLVDFALIGAYGVTKTAMLGLVKVLAGSLAHYNIRVNAIAPGLIKTKLSSALWKDESAESKENTAAVHEIPLGRIGVPEDCANLVTFLASNEASFITGETVVVAGGAHSRL